MVTKSDVNWAWDQASKIRGENPNLWRKDELGHEIYRPAYGAGGDYGWQVDHRNPQANGGTDHRRNLRALQTRANQRKSDRTSLRRSTSR